MTTITTTPTINMTTIEPPLLPTKTLVEEDLPMQVDSVSWNKSTSLLAIGAYQLDPEDSSKRLGRIYLIKLTPTIPGGFTVVDEHSTPGILDLKWGTDDTLAVATSESIQLYTLEGEKLIINNSLELSSMALFIQWIDSEEDFKRIVFSDSNGFVNICKVEHDNTITLCEKAKLHPELAWVVHVNGVRNC
jgi:hypothetical protein